MANMKFPNNDRLVAHAKANGHKGSYNDLLIAQLQDTLASAIKDINVLTQLYFENNGVEFIYEDLETFNITTESGDTLSDELLNLLITE